MKPNFQILDGLRGIAALYVLINHARGFLHIGGQQVAKEISINEWNWSTKIYYALLQFTNLGNEFVIFFFVLSGFSIAYALSKKRNIITFYKRRLIRIYPPYLFALFWAFLVYFWINTTVYIPEEAGQGNVFNSSSSIIQNLFFIPTGSLIIPFWSLVYEVIFYILAPIFLIKYARIYLAFSILFWIYTMLFYGKESEIIILAFFQKYSLYFALGIIFYQNYQYISTKISSKKIVFLIISIVSVSFLIIIKFKVKNYLALTELIMACLSVYIIANFQTLNIQHKILRLLGKMSYTIYITHFASLFLFKYLFFKIGIIDNTPIKLWYVWILAVIFSVFLAYIFYVLVEKQSKKILDLRRKA